MTENSIYGEALNRDFSQKRKQYLRNMNERAVSQVYKSTRTSSIQLPIIFCLIKDNGNLNFSYQIVGMIFNVTIFQKIVWKCSK